MWLHDVYTIAYQLYTMNATTDYTDLINQLNTDEARKLAPAFIYLIFLIISGTIGNILVIIVYYRCFRPSNIRHFIICLGVIDLFTCCVVIPIEMAVMTMPYTFRYRWLCKTSRFLNTLVTLTSAGLLLLIALDRQRKMCKPFGWQIDLKYAKYLCALAVIAGLLPSLSALFIYGCKTLPIPGYNNVTGTECSIDDSMKGTPIPLAASIVMCCIFIVGMTIVSILYCLIGGAVHRHIKHMPKDFRAVSRRSLKQRDSITVASLDDISYDFIKTPTRNGKSTVKKSVSIQFDTLDRRHSKVVTEVSDGVISESNTENDSEDSTVNYTTDMSSIGSECSDTKTQETKVPKRQSEIKKRELCDSPSSDIVAPRNTLNNRRNRSQSINSDHQTSNRRKTSMLMFIISSTYIISFVPHLLLMLIREINPDYIINMSASGRVAYSIFLRSYFLNFAANPVIYSLYGTQFRSECKSLFRTLCTRKQKDSKPDC